MQTLNKSGRTRKFDLQRIVVLAVAIVLAAVFSIASKEFRQYTTIVTLLDSFYYFAFMSIGVTFCLISGGNDLSVGTGMVCYAMIAGMLVKDFGCPVWVGMIVALILGLLFGALNGVMVSIMNLPAFIATLCTMLITRGLSSVACGGASISWPARASEEGWFRNIFKYMMPNALGKKTPIPTGLIVVLVAIIIMSIILNKTRIGRYIIAIGSNKEAARLSGVNVVKYQMSAYIISGLFAGIAGIAFAASNASSITASSGLGLELDAIGGAIIGGTSMTGGSGSIIGSMIGILILALLKNGLPKIGLTGDWQHVITGVILIAAIWFDVIKNRKKA